MSLKLPGIGKTVDSYSYQIIKGTDTVRVIIDYQAGSKQGTQIFNLRTDPRFETTKAIEDKVKEYLEMGHGRHKVEIREDKPRVYIEINFDKFTGNLEK